MAVNDLPTIREPSPISANGVTLRIPMVRRSGRSLSSNPFSMLANFYKLGASKREVRTIIEGVSFTLEPGHRLALIGRNGAGKTTLLRLLAGSYHPSRGSIATYGTIQALLNLSLGLRHTATGLENIYLRGLAMGMNMAEIHERVPDIVAFTELGDAIYDPIQTYSAGMRARLAFSIMTSKAPNIVLMDEWVSTGDRFFVKKAQERLETQLTDCKALVLASHSRAIMSEICTHGLVLERGRRLYFGKIDEALKFYEELTPETLKAAAAAAGT